MNEAQTRRLLIDPALMAAGWGGGSASWVAELPVAPGRIGSDAEHHNPKFADYVLTGWLIDGPNIPGRPFWVMRHRTPLLT